MRHAEKQAKARALAENNRVCLSGKERYCISCWKIFPRPPSGETDLCRACLQAFLDSCTVYDRDRGLGQLPPNLRKYEETNRQSIIDNNTPSLSHNPERLLGLHRLREEGLRSRNNNSHERRASIRSQTLLDPNQRPNTRRAPAKP